MKNIILALLLFCVSASAQAVSVKVRWTGIPASDLAGYRVYYGTTSGAYPQVKDAGMDTEIQIDGLSTNGTYYFVVTAYNKTNLESLPSKEASVWLSASPTDVKIEVIISADGTVRATVVSPPR